jgi:hypothetical protein
MRRARLRPQSAKRRREQAERRKVLARLLEERGPGCEARVLNVCAGLAVDGHELLARSAGGSITDAGNILLVCRRCHDWIGERPREATSLGLRRSRYGGAA